MVNCTDFEKLSHIIEHGLQGFIVKNIEGESTSESFLNKQIASWTACQMYYYYCNYY